MIDFLKTFGKGLLYFILLPLIILFLLIYGFYLFILFIISIFKIIVLFFQGKNVSIKDELDEEALKILRSKKDKKINENDNSSNKGIIHNTYNTFNLDVDSKKLTNNSNLIDENDILYKKDAIEVDTQKENKDD